MFDFDRIASTVGSLLGNQSLAEALPLEQVTQALESAGIDPAMLQSLAPEEVVGLLQQHGIDLSSLPVDQLQGMVEQLGNSGLGNVMETIARPGGLFRLG